MQRDDLLLGCFKDPTSVKIANHVVKLNFVDTLKSVPSYISQWSSSPPALFPDEA